MKYTLAIAALLVAAGSNAWAEGHVSQSQLADFGLANMSEMTDAQGSEVRGQGFAFAASISASALPGTFTFNPAVAGNSGPGPNVAQANSGAASSGSFNFTIITFPPLGIANISGNVAVGSAGFANARSN